MRSSFTSRFNLIRNHFKPSLQATHSRSFRASSKKYVLRDEYLTWHILPLLPCIECIFKSRMFWHTQVPLNCVPLKLWVLPVVLIGHYHAGSYRNLSILFANLLNFEANVYLSSNMTKFDINSKLRMNSGYDIPILGYGVYQTCRDTTIEKSRAD